MNENPPHSEPSEFWIDYAAYGSNMNRTQMLARTQGEAKSLGSGLLQGWQPAFRRGVLTIEPMAGACVPLAFWRISPGARQALDRYEGAPFLYAPQQRHGSEVIPQAGRVPDNFLIYEMTAEGINLIDRPDYPGTAYFDTCAQGYRDAGLEAWLWVLEAARERSVGKRRLPARKPKEIRATDATSNLISRPHLWEGQNRRIPRVLSKGMAAGKCCHDTAGRPLFFGQAIKATSAVAPAPTFFQKSLRATFRG